ncbi:EI24 domain-containing protein [Sphingomonas corticis]|jgi:uncharacterized protein involved in cysteine biosynthesis|uniref:EI24 domain-containing protein n=1 Tax=Sphingomonas corticis TaxID=2722791 RepID=A0ABX1CLN2_9SPHN|nr:EI24 domain-containing protein [Sphingomonas corticis]NJR77275.1 hypothetical protein [Sphingomonas corticis]
MVRAFLLSLGQLGDRVFVAVLAKSLALTLAIFLAAGAGLWFGIDRLLADWSGHGALAGAAALVLTVLGAWLLFRAVAIAVVGLFADAIVEAVERRHYPAALASARSVPLARGIGMGLASAARVVGINLLLAPVYVALLVTGVGTAALFLLVNAWLLGRDLTDMVAARHLPRQALAGVRAETRGRRFLLGLAGTLLLTVPLVNILAPVLGAAMATHLFHGHRR